MTGIPLKARGVSKGFSMALCLENIFVWFLALLIGETWHQYRIKTGVPLKSKFDVKESMSRAEFDSAVHKGRKLIIVDDLVVDVEEYITHHPGGKFVIEHCIGQDISKFFFGGFSLENNIDPKTKGYHHSYAAYMIVNELTVAYFEDDIPCSVVEVMHDQAKATSVNADTKTITLKSANRCANLKHHYSDFRVLGKHFRVTIAGDPNFSRHYTICNVMMKRIYDAYLESLEKCQALPSFAVDDSDKDNRTFTVKNYERGMSATFFNDAQTVYNIKGPIGKGFLVEPKGLHVAFGAGTGVLTFMDTVAFAAEIALAKVLSLNEKEKGPRVSQTQFFSMQSLNADTFNVALDGLNDDFEFILYVSFQNRE